MKTVLKSLVASIKGDVIYQKEITKFYSVDSSSYKIQPKIIVIVKDEADVVNTVKIAKKFKTSVTVRGAGTGLVGSALNSGIILDLKNLDQCSVSKNYIKVGPGTLKGILDKKLNKSKMFFAPNPSIGSFCSVGGMIGNNSSGSRSLKYGSVIDNVFEITFVNGDGKIITLPQNKTVGKKILELRKQIDETKFPNVTKNSSGYRIDKVKTINDTHKIIIGSEGTLGIVLSAKLKIIPVPKKRILFVIEYNSINQAAKNCTHIIKTRPSAIEIVDKTTLIQIRYKFNPKTKCLLFVEYDERVNSKQNQLKEITTGKICKVLKNKNEIFKWWKFRDSSLHYSLKSIKKENRLPHIIEDAAVPLERLPKLFAAISKINKEFKTRSIVYGHAGNGNIHVRLVGSQKTNIKKIADRYFSEIIKLGGTISAEHGDGLARSEFIQMQYGSENYQIFKKIKRYFDSSNLLNPNKIISKKSTVLENLEIN